MKRHFPPRPSRPRMCRKRRAASRLNPAGRFALDARIGSHVRRRARFAPFGSGFTGLDPSRLASGQKISRAMDVNVSDRGSEHEHCRKKKGRKSARHLTEVSFSIARFSVQHLPFSRSHVVRVCVFSCPRLCSVPAPFAFFPGRFSGSSQLNRRFPPAKIPFCAASDSVFFRPTRRFASPPVFPGRMGTVLHTAPSCQRAGRPLDSRSVRHCASHTPQRQKP